MPKQARRLTSSEITGKKAGLHADGNGLYLHVSASGARSWIFRFTSPATKRVRAMGLGSLRDVEPEEARDIARDLRRRVKREKIDPIERTFTQGLTVNRRLNPEIRTPDAFSRPQ